MSLPQVEETKQAKAIFKEAKEQSRTAIRAREIGDGLVLYQLGNVQPETLVVVEVKACVFSHMCAEDPGNGETIDAPHALLCLTTTSSWH